MASHASSFADLLNAVTGFRVKLVEADEDIRLAGDVYGAALRMQRTEREIFVAMTEALDERIEDVREAARLRSRRLGVPAMRVAHLLCPLPDRRWGPGRGPEVMRADIARVFGRTDPGFAAFVEEAHEKGRINAQTLPMKAGGGWCDNMPAAGAVRIIANTFPNVAGEAQMTHLLGAGHLHRVLQRCSAGERLVPLSMIELAGNVYETLLVRGLEAEAAASGDEAEEPLLWLMLQRISNLLLAVSARHRLLARIYRERGDRVLSAAELNVLSDESWRHYFGDSTLETDRYVWVHKPHFYRQGTLFYDWQYVLGFLVSNLVRVACANSKIPRRDAARWRRCGSMRGLRRCGNSSCGMRPSDGRRGSTRDRALFGTKRSTRRSRPWRVIGRSSKNAKRVCRAVLEPVRTPTTESIASRPLVDRLRSTRACAPPFAKLGLVRARFDSARFSPDSDGSSCFAASPSRAFRTFFHHSV